MNLTRNFKSWLVKECDVDVDATDDEFKAAAAKALVAGDLTPDKLKSLSEEDEDEEASAFKDLLVDLKDAVVDLKNASEEDASEEDEEADDETDADDSTEEADVEEGKSTEPSGDKSMKPSRLQKMIVSVGAHISKTKTAKRVSLFESRKLPTLTTPRSQLFTILK